MFKPTDKQLIAMLVDLSHTHPREFDELVVDMRRMARNRKRRLARKSVRL